MGGLCCKNSTRNRERKRKEVAKHMQCISFAPDVRIGDFYNIHEDTFSPQNKSIEPLVEKIKPEKTFCDVFEGADMNIDLLLKILGADYQMALNTFIHSLHSSKSNGWKDFFKCAQHTNDHTRLFVYTQACEKEMLSVPQTDQSASDDQPVTHVVDEVTFGLALLIGIEIPAGLELRDVVTELREVDRELRLFCSRLCRDQNSLNNHKPLDLLDKLKIKSQWSNQKVPVLFDKVTAIRDYIEKQFYNRKAPLSFCLQTIEKESSKQTDYQEISTGIARNILRDLLTLDEHWDEALKREGGSATDDKLAQSKTSKRQLLQSLKMTLKSVRSGEKDQYALLEIMCQNKYQPLFKKSGDPCVAISSQTNDSSSQIDNDIIPNILLLGETGVGKSTFINALVNYLQFETLEEAQAEGPSVVLPAKFLITPTNKHRNEIIGLGAPDSNEQHGKLDQSVTQQCKTYNIKTKNNSKFKIIDTPGFGDTRGRSVDKRNIENILSIIRDIKNLNAVCVLLKPNVSRSDIIFRSNLAMLFRLLPAETRKNVLFCFTNTRSTFYLPGDTAPLLIQMLQDLPGDRIRYESKNTFCFDSESFRYLVAVKNKIKFENDRKLEYKESWSRSVDESHRWLGAVLSLKILFASTPELTEHQKNEDLSVAQDTAKSSEHLCSAANSSLNQDEQEESFSV